MNNSIGNNKKILFDFWNTSVEYHRMARSLNLTANVERLQMAALISGNGLVLDLGCGSAENSLLIKNNDEYVGADVSFKALTMARGYDITKLVCCDLANLPFRDGTFGSIISTQVLEHLHEPEAVIGEAARVCRRKAMLVIIAPRFDWPFAVPGSLRHRYWGRPLAKLFWAMARIWKDLIDAVRRMAGRPVNQIILSPDITGDGKFLPDDDVVYLVRTPEVAAMVKDSGFEIESLSPREWWNNRSKPLVLKARRK